MKRPFLNVVSAVGWAGRGVGVFLAAGMVAGALTGCADEKRSSGAASKPLAPPSYQDPVAPAIPEPNTNASMSQPEPAQQQFSTPPAPVRTPSGANPIINAP